MIRSSSLALLTSRFVGSSGRRRHLWNHASLTPTTRQDTRCGTPCSTLWLPMKATTASGAFSVTSPRGVGSGRGAVLALRPARFPGPPSAPAVPVPEQRALHKPRLDGALHPVLGHGEGIFIPR